MPDDCLPNTIWAAGGWWTPGIRYVIEPRGWSRDLPEEFRQQRRPQTLLLQRYMEPPRLDREGERQLERYFERFEIRSAPAETADGFALADAFENYGIRNTSIFHLTDNWHRTWAGDSQFYPQRDPETLRNVLRTPPDQWGHEVFYRNPGRFSIPAEAKAATLHFKIKIPEQAGHDVTLGPAFNVSGGGASKVEEKFAAAIKVRGGHIDYFNPAATENQWPRAVDSASIGSWHGVWLVIDNVGGTYDLYIDPGATREAVDSDQLVAERIALNYSGETIDHFLLTTHGKGVVFLTDIYFDAVQKNLNQPNPIR